MDAISVRKTAEMQVFVVMRDRWYVAVGGGRQRRRAGLCYVSWL